MKMFVKKLASAFKKSRAVRVSQIFFILSILFLAGVLLWISYQNKKIITYEQYTEPLAKDGELEIFMEIPVRADGVKNCWPEENGTWGAQYDIYIINKSKYPFVDWELTMDVPNEARIDSSWNGTYEQKPGKIIIHGAPDLTAVANPHDKIRVGYVLYTRSLMQRSHYILTGRFQRSPLREILFIVALILSSVALLIFIVSFGLFFVVQRQQEKDDEKIESLIKLCARFIDVRDEYTKMHSLHVGYYAKKIAELMGFDEEFQKNIYYMGLMHDVGKVMLPREILCKKSKLNDEEWQEMKKHTSYGAEILERFTAVPGIREAVLYHHERWDGTGYPEGLKENAIPIQARIIGVADAYDAMHTNRSYRSRLSDDIIFEELQKNKRTQFDPEVAEAMIVLIKKHAITHADMEH